MRVNSIQQAEIIKIIDDIEFDKSLFDLSEENNTFLIKFINDYYLFIVIKEHNKYIAKYKSISNNEIVCTSGVWEHITNCFTEWIKDVQSDYTQKLKNNINNKINIMQYEEIKVYSESFVRIYNQALQAEKTGLDEICGLGYRKAFEFLIKDYLLLNKESTFHTNIINSKLQSCIKDYIEDSNIKLIAERAVWLGNDHTHYIVKWKDKTLNDLKDLIHITTEWIVLTEKTKKKLKSY